jgi:hypothetical protein
MQFEVRQTLLEDKGKRIIVGEVGYNEAWRETPDLETSIAVAKLELRDLEKDHAIIS